MIEGAANVVDTRAALADALGDQPCAAMQVQLAHVGRVARVGDEGERMYRAAARQASRYEARLVDPPRHFAMPQAREAAGNPSLRHAESHAPAGAAAA